MKHLFATLALIASITAHAQQEQTCYAEVQNAAAMQAAADLNVLVQDLKVARYEQQSGVNTRGNLDVSISMYKGKELQHMMIKVQASNCEIKSIKALDESSLDELALQSMKYKLAIKDTVWMSEGDSEWFVFYTTEKVSKTFSKASLRKAIGVDAATEMEVYSHEIAVGFFDTDENMENADRHNYKQLKEELLKDFTELRAVKIGKPDSGALEIIIFGRTNDGRLVGVRTLTIET